MEVMLDLLLIQECASGITLFEYKHEKSVIDEDHAFIFSGFLSAINHITNELTIGIPTLLSTTSHHCLMHRVKCIDIIAIIDLQDDLPIWQEKIAVIGREFHARYFHNNEDMNNLRQYYPFREYLATQFVLNK